MEMHGFDVAAMHARFRFGQSREHRQDTVHQGGSQPCRSNPLTDVRPLPVGRIRLERHDIEPLPPQTTTAVLTQIQPHRIKDPDLTQGLFHHRQGHPEVEQRSQKHVPGKTGGTVDMQRRNRA